MRIPTRDQDAVLESPSRVRIVEAAPGSGKTWLIAEAMRREKEHWTRSPGGIAALSFTNVAGEEIATALGGEPPHPHLVATIDKFLFRYIVKPFAARLNPDWPEPRLLPADAVESVHFLSGHGDVRISVPGSQWKTSVFNFNFVDEQDGQPILSVAAGWRRSTLDAGASVEALEAKKKIWRDTGYLSHSDVAYVASRIVTSFAASGEIAKLIGDRFPLMIVDELQDTGWYRASVLRTLLGVPYVRALLVGDPDQAIYEFNGAKPEVFALFKSLPGSQVLSLSESRRCPPKICAVACELSHTSRSIVPHLRDPEGEVTLIVYDDAKVVVQRYEEEAERRAPEPVVLVARKNAQLDRLRGHQRPARTSLRSRPVELSRYAVLALRRGNQRRALTLAEAALARVVFGHEAPSESEIASVGLLPSAWKQTVVAALLEAEACAEDISIYDWGCELKTIVRRRLEADGLWSKAKKPQALRAPARKVAEKLAWGKGRSSAESQKSALRFSTVHGVKGETHHTTVLFVPKGRPDECPSRTWWLSDPRSREEARVAFVAATRANSTFVLAVPEGTYERLREHRASFVGMFVVEELST